MQLRVRLLDAPAHDAEWMSSQTFDSYVELDGLVQGPPQLLSEYVTEGTDPSALQEELTEVGYYTHVFDVGDCYYEVTAIAA